MRKVMLVAVILATAACSGSEGHERPPGWTATHEHRYVRYWRAQGVTARYAACALETAERAYSEHSEFVTRTADDDVSLVVEIINACLDSS